MASVVSAHHHDSGNATSSKSRLLHHTDDDDDNRHHHHHHHHQVVESQALLDFAATRFKSRLSDSSKPEEMMLLEKQGRSSQRQRMQDEQRRAGSLPPSSLPRPPKSMKNSNAKYARLSDSETRKKSDAVCNDSRDSGNCTLDYGRFDTNKVLRRKKSSESIMKKALEYERLSDGKHSRDTQVRSLIPPPSRRVGIEYGRLSEGDAKTRKSHESSAPSSRGQSTGSIMSTKSEATTASTTSSSCMLKPPGIRSIPRPSNYRIQF